MTIAVGQRLPQATFMTPTKDGPQPVTTDDVFKGKRVALFAVPGAFTPTCDARHLPGFAERAHELKKHGVDTIACTATNDAFVMGAWNKASGSDDVMMLADAGGDFVRAIGLDIDLGRFGLGGARSHRYSMIVNDGVVESLNLEEPGAFEVSSADYMLKQMA